MKMTVGALLVRLFDWWRMNEYPLQRTASRFFKPLDTFFLLDETGRPTQTSWEYQISTRCHGLVSIAQTGLEYIPISIDPSNHGQIQHRWIDMECLGYSINPWGSNLTPRKVTRPPGTRPSPTFETDVRSPNRTHIHISFVPHPYDVWHT